MRSGAVGGRIDADDRVARAQAAGHRGSRRRCPADRRSGDWAAAARKGGRANAERVAKPCDTRHLAAITMSPGCGRVGYRRRHLRHQSRRQRARVSTGQFIGQQPIAEIPTVRCATAAKAARSWVSKISRVTSSLWKEPRVRRGTLPTADRPGANWAVTRASWDRAVSPASRSPLRAGVAVQAGRQGCRSCSRGRRQWRCGASGWLHGRHQSGRNTSGQVCSAARHKLGRQSKGNARWTMPASPVVHQSGAARSPQRRTALVLQGGGALGSYQAGACQALEQAGMPLDWVAGVSICAGERRADRRARR